MFYRLANQHFVERIAVVIWQMTQVENRLGIQWQAFNKMALALLLDKNFCFIG